jgi:outer membrane protein assembly factor BamB
MKNKYLILLISIMIVIVGFASAVSASNWTQFQTDEKHTGVTADNGPDDGSISINWSKAVGNGMIDTVPLVLGDYVYVEGASKLSKYNKNSGDFVANLTVAETGGYIFQNACPASDGIDTIYVVDTGYGNKLPKIKAINATSMTERWSTTFSNGANQCSCPVTYYNDSGNGKLFVGTVNMSKTDSTNLTDDGTYYAFDASNGQELWNLPTNTGGGYYWAGAAVVGNFVVYPDDSGYLTSVNISTGSRTNQTRLSSTNQIRASATYNANDHVIYTAGKDGYVYSAVIDPTTGIFGTLDSYYMGWSSISTPAYNVADHRIYAASGSYQHGKVYCFNATTMDLIWTSADLQHLIQSSPAVADDDVNNPLIFVTDNDATGKVYRIEDQGTTANVTSLTPSNNTYSLAGVAISGDCVYFGNDNGYLYQVK